MGSFNNVSSKLYAASVETAKLSSFVGKGTIITDYLASTNGVGNVPYMTVAVPILGIAESALGMVNTVTALLRDATLDGHERLTSSAKVERGVIDLLATFNNIQLLAFSLDGLATGTVVPVYYGFAISYGIKFAMNLYNYAQAKKALLAHEQKSDNPEYFKVRTDLITTMNSYYDCILPSAVNCIAFTYLTVGHPIGFAVLGLTWFVQNIDLIRRYSSNLESLLFNMGKVAVITDYVARITANDLGNFSNAITSVIPIWGIACGAFGVLDKASGLLWNNPSYFNAKERVVPDIIFLGAYINLLNSSL
jgi:hypothetical protein